MATSDISRSAFDPRKHYTGVRMQQGRVVLDDDWNESERIAAEERRRTRLDVVGPSGSPDGGFRITGPRLDADGRVDFDIGAGTFYLGGRRLVLDEAQTFRTQADLLLLPPNAHPAPAAERIDLAFLVTYEVAVEAGEDGELLEAGLGGPDTSTRIRTIQHVALRENVGTDDCAEAWQDLVDAWAAGGAGTLDAAHELRPDVRLTVGYAPGGDPSDLCTPLAAGGYLGAENQAIRIQLVDAGHLVWGFNNGSPLYRVQAAADRQTLTLLTPPRDQAHWPLADQVVEVLPWSAVLPNGEKVADVRGHLTRVASSYQPDDGTLTLVDPIPTDPFEHWRDRPDAADLEGDGAYYFLRVWDRGSDLASDPAISFTPGTPLPLGTTGLEVTIEGPDRRPGDHWIVAARPETPDQVVPWSLEAGRAPHGIRRFYTPLALIHWYVAGGGLTGTDVHDCREPFLPLTRQGTCCTVRVGDGTHSHGQYTSIQAAVDALPPSGGQVCVLPGTYRESVVLEGRRGVTITGCGRRSRIDAAALDGGGAPGITIRGGSRIRVESLAVDAADAAPGVLVTSRTDVQGVAEEPTGIRLVRLRVRAATRSAVEVRDAEDLAVQHCRLLMRNTASVWPALYVAARQACVERNVLGIERSDEAGDAPLAALGGLQLAGGCEDVRVEENRIEGGLGHGITLGSVHEVTEAGEPGEPVGWVVNRFDPCNPCAPGDVFIPPRDDADPTTWLEPDGALYDIALSRNLIADMGLCGIGVAGFFDLDADDRFISVFGLDIVGNEIRRCLQRELAEIPEEMLDAMGYGGIALADVTRLRVRENRITENGPSRRDPVCGVFVLHGEDVAFVENVITENGAWADVERQRPGRRGGIHVVFAVAPTAPGTDDVPQSGTAAPAARVHGNTVQAPLGQALTLRALGPVHVTDNRFTSQGVVVGSDYTTVAAATVGILNLGVAFELAQLGMLGRYKTMAAGEVAYGRNLGAGAAWSDVSPETPFFTIAPDGGVDGLDDYALGVHPAGGGVVFNDNQVLLDLTSSDSEFFLSSVLVIGFDDIAFEDNQCVMRSPNDFGLVDALVAGFSPRVVGNRFAERFVGVFLSALTLGVVNTTAHNQATNCMLVRGATPALTVDTPNTVLVDALAQNWCGLLGELIGSLLNTD